MSWAFWTQQVCSTRSRRMLLLRRLIVVRAPLLLPLLLLLLLAAARAAARLLQWLVMWLCTTLAARPQHWTSAESASSAWALTMTAMIIWRALRQQSASCAISC
ncbi:hypothetical protein JKP88DRAFT_223234 [Tribonema minus]|uniref:Uncharacterized protein n=1 Tax=Tribonema minus TaxID=303371 RepID=A0A835YRY3_9STRA|nr:hypothetical protein JKP88DRAFT_223234 [Tribonema minus]